MSTEDVKHISEPEADTGYRLVFVHGAGSDSMVWSNQTDFFKHSEAITLPGHRLHEFSGNDPMDSIVNYALWLNGLLHSERRSGHEKHKTVLVGHSMGAAISLACAIQFGEYLAGLVLVGAGAKMRVSPQILQGLRSDFAGTARSIVDACFTPGFDEKVRHGNLQTMTELGANVSIADFEACDAFDVRAELDKLVNLPTLVITGNADQMTPPKYAHFLAENIKGAQLDLVDAAGHNVMQEKPHEFNRILDNFLSNLID